MKRKINIDGLDVSFIDEGEGIPFLLLHGWGCTGEIWRPLIDDLSRDCRVIAPDLPGFGDSDEPPEDWETRDYARLFVHFMKEEGIHRPVIIGHSNGGRVGIVLAASGYAEKLLLTDSAGIKPHRHPSYYAKVYSYKALKKTLSLPVFGGKGEELISRSRERMGSDDYNEASPVMRKILSSVVNEDLIPYIELIKVPTLLVWGSEDSVTPPSDGEKMEAVLKKNDVDTALILFPGREHYAFLEDSVRFNAVCRAFTGREAEEPVCEPEEQHSSQTGDNGLSADTKEETECPTL